MARAELINKEEPKKKWEPYLTLTLSKNEAGVLRAVLGGIALPCESPIFNVFEALTRAVPASEVYSVYYRGGTPCFELSSREMIKDMLP